MGIPLSLPGCWRVGIESVLPTERFPSSPGAIRWLSHHPHIRQEANRNFSPILPAWSCRILVSSKLSTSELCLSPLSPTPIDGEFFFWGGFFLPFPFPLASYLSVLALIQWQDCNILSPDSFFFFFFWAKPAKDFVGQVGKYFIPTSERPSVAWELSGFLVGKSCPTWCIWSNTSRTSEYLFLPFGD